MQTSQLSEPLEQKVLEIFNKMDTDHSKVIERKEVIAYWTGKFPTINAEALFESVDVNNDGSIQLSEWVEFWRAVKASGHAEEEIDFEVRLFNY